MMNKILCAIAVLALITGCARWRERHEGGTSEGTPTVLTGGPTSGIMIADLPNQVRDTLKEKVPDAQVASIDKDTMNGRTVYHFTFSNPSKNAPLYIADDGTVVTNPTK